jgi:hypothetical protein
MELFKVQKRARAFVEKNAFTVFRKIPEVKGLTFENEK